MQTLAPPRPAETGSASPEIVVPHTMFEQRLKDALHVSDEDAQRGREVLSRIREEFIDEQVAKDQGITDQEALTAARDSAKIALDLADWFYLRKEAPFPESVRVKDLYGDGTSRDNKANLCDFYPDYPVGIPQYLFDYSGRVSDSIHTLFKRLASQPEIATAAGQKRLRISELVHEEIQGSPFVNYIRVLSQPKSTSMRGLTMSELILGMAQNEQTVRYTHNLDPEEDMRMAPAAKRDLDRRNFRLEDEQKPDAAKNSGPITFLDWLGQQAWPHQTEGTATFSFIDQGSENDRYPKFYTDRVKNGQKVFVNSGEASSGCCNRLSERFPNFSNDPNSALPFNRALLPYLLKYALDGRDDFIELAIADTTKFMTDRLVADTLIHNSAVDLALEYALGLYRQNVAYMPDSSDDWQGYSDRTPELNGTVDNRMNGKHPGIPTSRHIVESLSSTKVGKVFPWKEGTSFTDRLVMFTDVTSEAETHTTGQTPDTQPDGAIIMYTGYPDYDIAIPGYQTHRTPNGTWVLQKQSDLPDPYETADAFRFALVNNPQAISYLQDIGFIELAAALKGRHSLTAKEIGEMVSSRMRYTYDTSLMSSNPEDANPLAQYRGYIKNGRLLGQCDTAANFTADLVNILAPEGVHASVIHGHHIDTDGNITAMGHAQNRLISRHGSIRETIIDATPSIEHTTTTSVAQMIFDVDNRVVDDINELVINNAQLQAIQDTLTVFFGGQNFDSVAQQMLKLPKSDPIRKAYAIALRRVNDHENVKAEEIKEAKEYLEAYINADPVKIKAAGLHRYPDQFVSTINTLL